MKRKNKSIINIQNICITLSIIFMLVSIFMMFADSVKLGAKSSSFQISYTDVSYSGFDAIFGKTNVFKFSILNLLTIIFVIASIVLSILKLFNVLKKNNILFVISILMFISGLFFFLMGVFSVLSTSEILFNSISITKTIQIGAILAGIFSCLAATINLILALNKKK